MIAPYLREALLILALVSGIPLAVSSLVGLTVAITQAATQIQEQSVGYCAKLIAVGGVAVLLSDWFASKLVDFMQAVLASIVSLGQMS